MIGTGRTADRDRALGLGVDEFVDLETDRLEDAGEADVVLDLIGGDILQRSTALVRAGGTLVTTIEPPTLQPENGRAIFFVVEADRSQLAELAQRLRDGRLTSNVGAVRPLAEAPRRVRPRRSACVREDDHPSHRGLVNDHDRRRCCRRVSWVIAST